MSTHYLKHTVSAGDRWDTLAFFYYGDGLAINDIIDANPHITFCEVLPLGSDIWIPVKQAESVNDNKLPPWFTDNNDA